MKTVVYVSPFVPAEWIAAHGLRPCRTLVEQTEESSKGVPASGVCPYAREFISYALSQTNAAAIVTTTECDQMRRAGELIARDSGLPVFVMNVPTTWQTTTAQKLYIAELERLGRFMVRLGGKSPSVDELAKVMLEYDALRARIRAACGYVSARQCSEAIASFNRTGTVAFPPAGSVFMPRGIPLALVGGPLLANHFQVFDFVEEAGGSVVLDATETGERTMPVPFDRRRLQDDPFMELVDAYFGAIPDAFRRPNSELYRWLKKEIAERGVRGIVLRRYLWCDTWHAEVQRMKEWAEIPLLDLDIGDDDSDSRTASRIQSFVTMLK